MAVTLAGGWASGLTQIGPGVLLAACLMSVPYFLWITSLAIMQDNHTLRVSSMVIWGVFIVIGVPILFCADLSPQQVRLLVQSHSLACTVSHSLACTASHSLACPGSLSTGRQAGGLGLALAAAALKAYTTPFLVTLPLYSGECRLSCGRLAGGLVAVGRGDNSYSTQP